MEAEKARRKSLSSSERPPEEGVRRGVRIQSLKRVLRCRRRLLKRREMWWMRIVRFGGRRPPPNPEPYVVEDDSGGGGEAGGGLLDWFRRLRPSPQPSPQQSPQRDSSTNNRNDDVNRRSSGQTFEEASANARQFLERLSSPLLPVLHFLSNRNSSLYIIGEYDIMIWTLTP